MADEYDLMVIDHPHVGDIASSGILLPFDGQGFDDKLKTLAAQSVGVSHPSYSFNGRQWALAIDAATPVSAYRADMIEFAPKTWDEVVELAADGQVIWPLIPINTLMSYFNALSNSGYDFGDEPIGVELEVGAEALHQLKRVSDHIPQESFFLDPIALMNGYLAGIVTLIVRISMATQTTHVRAIGQIWLVWLTFLHLVRMVRLGRQLAALELQFQPAQSTKIWR